jgi:hypothetical protein
MKMGIEKRLGGRTAMKEIVEIDKQDIGAHVSVCFISVLNLFSRLQNLI